MCQSLGFAFRFGLKASLGQVGQKELADLVEFGYTHIECIRGIKFYLK